jgi:hypothetical protein
MKAQFNDMATMACVEGKVPSPFFFFFFFLSLSLSLSLSSSTAGKAVVQGK